MLNELRKNVETLAQERNQTPIEIISMLQYGSVKIENETLLDQLSELKWEYIDDLI